MAEKRMFAKSIVNSDAFLDMPLSTQALYFHLCMEADDEGFVGNPRRIQRIIGASDDDMRILLTKRYLLTFESGIMVVKHWYINNYIQSDRKKETTYLEEKNMLTIDSKKAYTERYKNELDTQCIQNGYNLDTQIRLDKNRLDKTSIDERENAHTHEEEIDYTSDLDCLSGIPTLQEVKDFITLKEYPIDAEYFYNYYMAQGWKRNGYPIENWQSLVIQWGRKENMQNGLKDIAQKEQQEKPQYRPQQNVVPNFEMRKYTQQEMDDIFNSISANNISDDDI